MKYWLPVVAVLACAAGPAQAQFGLGGLSAEEERKLAAEQHPELVKENGGVYSERQLDEYLVQIGLLDPKGLPVSGAEVARKVVNPKLASRVI